VPATDAVTIWSALVQKDGSVLLGTGNEGKILSSDGATVKAAAETGALVVTSLVEGFGGSVFAGTLPDGEIFKYAGGKATKFVKLDGVEHVWGLAFVAKTKSLFAATGPEGKLFRVDAQGTAQVYFDAPEQHLMSVAVAHWHVYAGLARKRLYASLGRAARPCSTTSAAPKCRQSPSQQGDVFAVANG
jgi:hypothetical protein